MDDLKNNKTEEAISVTNEDWESMFNTVTDCITVHDTGFNIVRMNQSARDLFGLQLHDHIPSLKCFQCYHGTDKPPSECPSCLTLKTGRPSTVEIFEPHLGKHLEIMALPRFGSDGQLSGLIHVVRDITNRKESEKALQRAYDELEKRAADHEQAEEISRVAFNAMVSDLRESENKFRNFSDQSLVGINLIQDSSLVYVNPKFADIFGYTVEQCMNMKFMDFVYPEDMPIVQEQIRRRLSGEVTQVHYEFRGIKQNKGIVPIEIFGSSVLFNGRPAATATILDITARKQAEQHLEATLESLRKAFGATIQVMAAAVEARDPYTAGHQLRAANIARAIAGEMGLSQEIIEGIRIAGSIHDIGKLSLPAEILTKPTKLSELEFALIKEHASRGFEMVKDIESPWPLAEIVYQHHERMDGSGYPRKLKGEEICLEARILTVADVVEAMASHRPYRRGLGIDAALNEIEKNRGVFYDATVADACLTLFRKKGFKLEGT